MHNSAYRVGRQFGLDQDMTDDFTLVLDTTTSVYPFLCPHDFKILE